jgi:sec-independent protein translocase protein TatC
VPLTLGRFGSQDPDRPLFAMSSVLEHLDRFRKGVIRSCIAVGVGILVAFAYINEIVEFVFRPIRSVLPPGSKMIYTVPGEAFSVYVTIALIAGVVLMSPFIMYQVWQIIAPALYVKQKRFAIWFILMTTAGFLGGAAFNHYVAFKMLMVFFASFNTTQLAFLPRLEDVFSMSWASCSRCPRWCSFWPRWDWSRRASWRPSSSTRSLSSSSSRLWSRPVAIRTTRRFSRPR